ncbi:MAG: divergent polysaccharide deacetylase family protein [Pseudomonadota bacterium]
MILGLLVSAIAFVVTAILVPLDPGSASVMPKPETIEEVAAVAPAPVVVPAPAPAPVEPAPAVVAPAPEPAPVVAEPVPEETAAAVVAPTPEPAPVTSAPQPQEQALAIPTPGAPQGFGEGPASISAPSIGGGPNFGETELGLGGTSDASPTRTTGGTQVAVAVPVTSQPTVDTASADVPDVVDGTDGVGTTTADDRLVELASMPLAAGSALTDNAVAFAGSTRPLMSIILQDDGSAEALRQGLLALSAPITFGVTANLSGAEQIAGDYRSKGYEVVAVMPGEGQVMERGDDPAAFRELISGVLDAVPGATGLMDRIGGPLPRDRALVQAALDSLTITGHGLLTHRGTGLNQVDQQADGAGVPSAVVYRVIDAEDDPVKIAQALDRAVLEASKTGQVIVVGRVKPATVTSLFSWLLGPGAKSVTIAPVSSILQQN